VNLSNGQSSPIFETQYAAEKETDKTIEFESIESIRAVKGLQWPLGVEKLEFYDKTGEMKYDYNPTGIDNRYSNYILEVKLEENQELIGVYGNNDGN